MWGVRSHALFLLSIYQNFCYNQIRFIIGEHSTFFRNVYCGKEWHRMKKLDEGFTYKVKEGILHSLGVTKTQEGVNFSVAVADGKRCSLLLYRKGSREVAASIPMGSSPRYGDIHSIMIEKLPVEKYEYNYLIDGQVVTDPYARELAGREVWGARPEGDGSVRGRAVFEEFDWQGDQPLHIPYGQVVAYATHVRGFTKHPSSKVKAKGTFAGIMEKIPYLKELGINQLELMPVYEFEERKQKEERRGAVRYYPGAMEEERLNYWGYTKGWYFAPKASYSHTGRPSREFKELVRALHQNGIELILEFYFPKGMRTSFVIDCIKFWALEYHIDGVHINRDHSPVEALAQEPLFSHMKIMTESFQISEIYGERHAPAYKNLAEYNDGFMMDARRFLKGDEGQVTDFVWRLRRNPSTHGVMNYMANHNGFTLMDLVSYDEKHNEANGEDNHDGSDFNHSWNCGIEGPSRKKKVLEMRHRQLRNAFAFLLLSQGTPLIYGGDEMANSQSGNNNVYCQDNELSWINWKPGKGEQFLSDYVKKLIAFRKAHPIFWQERELRAMDYLSCGYPDVSYHGKHAWYGDFETPSRSVGVLYAGDYTEGDAYFFAVYNMHWTPHDFALPSLPGQQQWRVALDTSKENGEGIYQEGEEILLEDQRIITVPERSVVVLTGK